MCLQISINFAVNTIFIFFKIDAILAFDFHISGCFRFEIYTVSIPFHFWLLLPFGYFYI